MSNVSIYGPDLTELAREKTDKNRRTPQDERDMRYSEVVKKALAADILKEIRLSPQLLFLPSFNNNYANISMAYGTIESHKYYMNCLALIQAQREGVPLMRAVAGKPS